MRFFLFGLLHTDMAVVLIVFALGLATIPLSTTKPVCNRWPFEPAWRRIGYEPHCYNTTEQVAITRKHCPDKPLHPIQYSDVSRLLILFEHGGWYVDSDVRPTPRCSHNKAFNKTTFGLESDFSDTKAAQMGMLQQSLSMWAIYGLKGDTQLKTMACTLARQSTRPVRSDESWYSYILHTSGPTAYTHLWKGPVLSVNVFGCGQRHSGAPPCSSPTCWGCHLFAGSWLTKR